MICRIFQMLIPLGVPATLPKTLKKWMLKHLNLCEKCSTKYNTQLKTLDVVKRIAFRDIPPNLSSDFAEKVLIQINKGNEEVARLPRKIISWSIAAAFVLVISSVLVKQFINLQSDTTKVPVVEPYLQTESEDEKISEESTTTEFKAIMSCLNSNPKLSDRELDTKYPVVDSISFPKGVQIVYYTDDPKIKIVWILPQEGGNLQ